MSLGSGLAGYGAGKPSDKSLRLPLLETLRLAWADPDLRQRLMFVLMIFAIYAIGTHIPVPVPGLNPTQFEKLIEDNPYFQLMNTFGGGALKRISVLALGLGPYITGSIIMQVLTMAIPKWKKDLQEGGEYARTQQNKKTRVLMLVLCAFQGYGLLQIILRNIGDATKIGPLDQFAIVAFWTAGAMFMLWLGEQITEKGIGNGVSLMIFAGIVISIPNIFSLIASKIGILIQWWQVIILLLMFLATTYFVVYFSIAQRRIPIQHMRRQVGTKQMGGSTSYLPLPVNLVGVIPIIFAVALTYIPSQFASMAPANSPLQETLQNIAKFTYPDFSTWQGLVGVVFYAALIFFFTYFYTAIQFNVEDMSDNLKQRGSFIPGVRPGKQTKEFLDAVISRITIVGAAFLTVVALTQYLVPLIARGLPNLGLLFGTSLLIMVSVALETMRQLEANLLMKQYSQ